MFFLFERLRDLFQLFFPETCEVCGNSLRYGEYLLCTDCLLDIPKIHLHNLEHNPAEKIFAGQVQFVRATAFFHYQKHSNFAHLIHKLKYQGREDIGVLLGEMFGDVLKKSGFLNDIDAIVPIPLHDKRLRIRGYNQSEIIAKGISNVSEIQIIDKSVIRAKNTKTQTKKSKEERLKNVQDIFQVIDAQILENKHILILDDVITTGATCISCAETIIKNSNVKAVSFASIALA